MCGIAGKIYLDSGEINTPDLKLMAEKIAHRGPDDEGIYISPNRKIGLVNRRLAIIDLSSAGHQPMIYKNRYIITYNGEDFYFRKDREILKQEGYRFNSTSDTEVILALYDMYKEKCLKYLNGMYAFAIYDTKENKVFLARDRLGKKPLKYYFKNGVFIFASELKAIVTQPEVKKNPNWQDINDYLTYGYVPAPNTGFEDIQKLEPGCYMVLDLKRKCLKKSQYWTPDFTEKLDLPESEWCKNILHELNLATKLRMISDVPIGAFLSGGVDSSAVVAMMARNSNKPIKTFTIIFKEKVYDERKYARKIARLYKTEHTELLAQPESVDVLPELVYQFEEPYANSSYILSHMVSKLAKKYVTVILNGDGGDELFAGYDRYARLKRDVFLDKFQPFIRPLAFPISKAFSPRSYKFLQTSKRELAERFVNYNCYFKSKDNLYKSEFKLQHHFLDSYRIAINKFKESKAKDKRDQARYFDMTVYFPDDLLTKIDISTMAVGVEARSPILDYKFFELAEKIPFDLKLKGLSNFKYIFKKALEPIVPLENLYRPKKGFSIPLSTWFTKELNTYTKSILFKKTVIIQDYFNLDEIRRMLLMHSEENDFGNQLWSILVLELWFETYFR